MKTGLIGFSGFVGSTLLKQTHFDCLYRAHNIEAIEGKSFDTVVCAGASALKWQANQEPVEDLQNIERLISALKTFRCKTFILISTVDVFKFPIQVDEETRIDEEGLHPYGLHRYFLEKFVESHFAKFLIIRLPGLVGPGLRKNIIFDGLNNNNLHVIDSREIHQFYPMVHLWYDIQTALAANLNRIHLTAEPIQIREVFQHGFGKSFDQRVKDSCTTYDMRTRHASLFGVSGHYQYSKRETLLAIRAYVQTEPRSFAAAAVLTP